MTWIGSGSGPVQQTLKVVIVLTVGAVAAAVVPKCHHLHSSLKGKTQAPPGAVNSVNLKLCSQKQTV